MRNLSLSLDDLRYLASYLRRLDHSSLPTQTLNLLPASSELTHTDALAILESLPSVTRQNALNAIRVARSRATQKPKRLQISQQNFDDFNALKASLSLTNDALMARLLKNYKR